MSGAGKSTISERLALELERRGRSVEILDGDVVRTYLSQGLGYTREDRDVNVARIAFVASLLTKHGAAVISAVISPYAQARAKAREQIGNYLEVFVHAPLDELVRRDVKGLYAKALRGEIPHFTGVSDDYEAPESPDITCNTKDETLEESVTKIINSLESRGWLAF